MTHISCFLNVHDLDASVAFYEALGFEVVHDFKDHDGERSYVDLELDGAELSLGRISANEDPEFQAWVSTPLGAGVMVTINVPDVDDTFDKAVQAGAEVEAKPADRPYGRVATLVDPAGYSINLFQL